MALSTVQIGNMALSAIGARSTIESLSEDTVEAQQINLWYNTARKQTLAAFDWTFARKRATLSAHSEDPPDAVWSYRYQYPVDCVAAREIENPLGWDADAVPFEIEVDSTGETKSILTDQEDAVLVYTFDQAAPVMFSSHFDITLAHLLGWYIAYSLTGSTKVQDAMLERYNLLVLQAPVHDANERVGRSPRDAPWIRDR